MYLVAAAIPASACEAVAIVVASSAPFHQDRALNAAQISQRNEEGRTQWVVKVNGQKVKLRLGDH